MSYNGWSNRATWSVALWYDNDEPLYRLKLEFLKQNGASPAGVKGFVMTSFTNPDGVDLAEVDWGEVAAAWAEDVPDGD